MTRTTLRDLAGEADAFLVDQFGTLHDGSRPYPGALEALLLLQAAGKPVILLSNSGKRAAPNEARLARLGFPRDSYTALISSGEVAWQMLACEEQGGACLLLSRGEDAGFLDGLPWRATDDPGAAELVLIAGSEADRRSLAGYDGVLQAAAARGLPCLCTNPDRTMLVEGGTAPGAGRIAERYAELGGAVTWIGKPHPRIYEAALARLGLLAGPRILAIGDSLEHDVAGAHRAGCRAALVLMGIAAGLDAGELADEAQRWGAAPDFVLEDFGP